jgi:hypothetical protein
MATEVVNVKVAHIRPGFANLCEWVSAENHVYIGRRGVVFVDGRRYPPEDSKWANPYKIGRDGSRDEVLAKYRNHIVERIRREPDLYNLEELRGKVLGCWCKPDSCHGDVLAEMLANL